MGLRASSGRSSRSNGYMLLRTRIEALRGQYDALDHPSQSWPDYRDAGMRAHHIADAKKLHNIGTDLKKIRTK